ncbi:MAG TPA: histidinol dehydrogenase [Terriglobales bacterium]|nr:histidinol dehydrogenase [Terriglobales bacterium]
MRVVQLDSEEGGRLRARLQARALSDLRAVTPAVSEIVSDVRERGEKALTAYGERWDELQRGQALRVSQDEMQSALAALSPQTRDALSTAAANIRNFAELQLPQTRFVETRSGVMLGQIVRALDAVGCYVPGGRYPLPSTLLMTVIPAQVAGVKRIVVCSPRPSEATLAAAALLGVSEFYRIGGAHAVAAMAFGTERIPAVNKIVGPGNQYVTAAKKLVAESGAVSIDMLAGPTEALILSRAGHPRFIAADLVAQAEHDPLACSLFVTTRNELAKSVARIVNELTAGNPTAREAIESNGAAIVTRSWEEAIAVANEIGSEHLTIDDEKDLERINCAGSIFIGDYSAQPLGDYVSGPNHVLPTAGTARFRGGLSAADFVKLISVQKVSRSAYAQLATAAETLAEIEGLAGHQFALQVRREKEVASA